ncbi:hypothetical protein ROZALSC1DRAFT_27250 [Rozella allomycis CSF55]|uniref:Uncharacterized protein n=1 Tax=Rozella allomycis (strain CSF55) TaxID=988480 RepID=A0A4P9YPA0_ROZAC|nr:hypothetical protein ROZALSC1DRAFT_27250 [Rozella allomycis CSF55]
MAKKELGDVEKYHISGTHISNSYFKCRGQEEQLAARTFAYWPEGQEWQYNDATVEECVPAAQD